MTNTLTMYTARLTAFAGVKLLMRTLRDIFLHTQLFTTLSQYSLHEGNCATFRNFANAL